MFCTAWLRVTSLYSNTLHKDCSTTFIVLTSTLFPRHRWPDWKHRWNTRWSVVETTVHSCNVTSQRQKRLRRPYVAGVALWHAPSFYCPNYAASIKQTPAIPHTQKKSMNFKFITNQLNIPYNTIYLTISQYISSDRFLLRSKYNIK